MIGKHSVSTAYLYKKLTVFKVPYNGLFFITCDAMSIERLGSGTFM